MKKIITLLLTLFIVQAYAQQPTLSLTSHTKDTLSEPRKQLIEITYEGKNVLLGRFANLDGINPDWISTVNILKGKSALALYGKDAVDGVITIGLKSGTETKAFFENEAEFYEKLTRLDPFQDASNRSFEMEKRTQSFKNQYITIRGESIDIGNAPMIIVEHNGEELTLKDLKEFNEANVELIESIQVFKDESSLKQYNATDKAGVIVIKLKGGKKSDKAYRELKKASKKR